MSASDDFMRDLASLLNRYSWDNTCNTPDFILAEHVERHLRGISLLTYRRDSWGHVPVVEPVAPSPQPQAANDGAEPGS